MASGRKEFTFLWFIENYSYCWHNNVGWLFSPRFKLDGLEGTAWWLDLYPNGERVRDKGFISLYLQRSTADDGPEHIPIKFELSVLAEDGSVLSSQEYDHSFEKYNLRGDGDFFKTDKILFQINFPQDILTVRCKMWKGEGDVVRVAPIHARTRIGVEKLSFTHVVKSFSKLQPNQKNIGTLSPSTTNKEALASSSLYFNFDSGRDGEILVEITPSHWIYFLCKRKISLLDASGNEILCADDDNRFDGHRKNIQKLTLSLTRRDILDKKRVYLPDDILSLKCECSFSTGLEFDQILNTSYEMPKAEGKWTHIPETTRKDCSILGNASDYRSMSDDLKTLHINMSFTDVELRTKTKSFPAHKNILCARSPVFERMLTGDMKEKKTDSIHVDDLADDVVQQLLLFLYSDTVEHLHWEMATQLYFAADKFEVRKLKAVCSFFLVENLSPTNVGDLLLLADTHSDTQVKKAVEDFLLEHEEQVFGLNERLILIEKNPPLVLKAMDMTYKKKN